MARAGWVARAAKTLGAAALGAGLFATTGGLIKVAPTPAQQRALADHYTNNDPIWTVLTSAVVSEDRAKGRLNAAFPPALAKLGGTEVRVSGFMTPLEAETRVRHFILTRRSTTCPFCPPNSPSEAVEVRLATPLPVTAEEVTVVGRMALAPASDEGLFYVMADARAVPRAAGG